MSSSLHFCRRGLRSAAHHGRLVPLQHETAFRHHVSRHRHRRERRRRSISGPELGHLRTASIQSRFIVFRLTARLAKAANALAAGPIGIGPILGSYFNRHIVIAPKTVADSGYYGSIRSCSRYNRQRDPTPSKLFLPCHELPFCHHSASLT